MRYLTGFSGSAGLLLVLPGSLVLLTDGRYGTQATAELEAEAKQWKVPDGACTDR